MLRAISKRRGIFCAHSEAPVFLLHCLQSERQGLHLVLYLEISYGRGESGGKGKWEGDDALS